MRRQKGGRVKRPIGFPVVNFRTATAARAAAGGHAKRERVKERGGEGVESAWAQCAHKRALRRQTGTHRDICATLRSALWPVQRAKGGGRSNPPKAPSEGKAPRCPRRLRAGVHRSVAQADALARGAAATSAEGRCFAQSRRGRPRAASVCTKRCAFRSDAWLGQLGGTARSRRARRRAGRRRAPAVVPSAAAPAALTPPTFADEDEAGSAAVGALQAALQDQQRRLSVACAQTAEYASASRQAAPSAVVCFCAPPSTLLRRRNALHLTYCARLHPPGSKEEEAKALLSQARRGTQRSFSCAASRCARAAP